MANDTMQEINSVGSPEMQKAPEVQPTKIESSLEEEKLLIELQRLNMEEDRILTDDDKKVFSKEEIKENPLLGLEGVQRAEERVQERDPIDIKASLAKFKEKGVMPKLEGGLETFAAPFRVMEAAISNPALAAQRGDYKDIPDAFIEAFKGKRVGEFGDVYVGAGMNEAAANVIGLATDIAIGGAILKKGMNFLGKGIVKIGDKVSVRAVDDIIKGVDRATEASTKLTNNFWKTIDNVKVNGAQLADDIGTLPKKVVVEIEEQLGKGIDEISSLAEVRKVKQILGSLKPSAFGKTVRGLSDALVDKKIKRIYGRAANFIEKTLTETSGLDKKVVANLRKTNDAAEEIINASNFIKNSLVGKGGVEKLSRGMAIANKASEAPSRLALQKLSKVKGARKARKLMEKGIGVLSDIAKREARGRLVGSIAKTVLFSGIAGSIGAASARKVLKGFDAGVDTGGGTQN